MAWEGQSVREVLREAEHVELVRAGLAQGVSSRTELAAELCEQLGLKDARGELRVSACLAALRDLAKDEGLELPPRLLDINEHWRPRRLAQAVPEPMDVPERVDLVHGLRVELVDPNDSLAMRTWNELICREHPRGEQRLVGRQLRYLVRSEHGYLGAVGFAACALALEARDRWIGWEAEQQQRHRDRVVNLCRLLIRPTVRCKNLASWVLAACTRRFAQDFFERFGFEPWLLETFVDKQSHEGTCFWAANWHSVGQTKGRGRCDREGRCSESIKEILVYPLVQDFRQRMEVAPGRGAYLRPLAVSECLDAETWHEQEFGGVELGDKRLRDRLIKVMGHRARHPGASYLAACGGDRTASKAFYAFVESPRESITAEAILATHRERTVQRMMDHPVVLVIQDTTDLNFTTRYCTEGLGVLARGKSGGETFGLKLHSSLAVTADGIPLGVLKSVATAPERKPKGRAKVNRPIEEKKSYRWIEGHLDAVGVAKLLPETKVISVVDREGDFYELLAEAYATRNHAGLLVRAKSNRLLAGGQRKLFDELRAVQERGSMQIAIPRQRRRKQRGDKPARSGRPSRVAQVSVAFREVTLRPTRKQQGSYGEVRLTAIHLREDDPPADADQVEWFLLTTEGVDSTDKAAEVIGWYARRWRIEEWHRVLKSCCRVEAHQHQTVDRLERMIAMDAVLAWRIQLLSLVSRGAPDLPSMLLFSEPELEVLAALHEQKTKERLDGPLPITLAVTLVAQLGGYLARKSDSPPGSTVLCRGMFRLQEMVAGFRLAQRLARGP